jgi:hypothetical protein
MGFERSIEGRQQSISMMSVQEAIAAINRGKHWRLRAGAAPRAWVGYRRRYCTPRSGNIRLHHLRWFRHMPHVVGQTDSISYNWWEYIVDPNRV